jgi:acylphosphatase
MRELLELSAIVKGDVQGVGFRATAKALAQQLKLTGFARNLADGSVEICAQGEKAQLEQLLAGLRKEFSAIHHIDFKFQPVKEKYADFKILRD